MKSSPKTGCIIRNENDPYQFQCVFSNDPEDKRDFSVYFRSPDGRQEIMASCTYDEGYECIFAREGLSLTEDFYITVSKTFSAQNGSFVCRNGGPALEQFPCFYSGNSVKPEVKCGMTEIGSNTLHNPGDFGTEDNDLAVIIGAVCGFLIILQFIFIGFLLFKNRKLRKEIKGPRWFIRNFEQTRSEKELLGSNLSEIDMTDWSIVSASESVSDEENEASDEIKTPAELRDNKVSPADTFQSEKASLPGK